VQEYRTRALPAKDDGVGVDVIFEDAISRAASGGIYGV